MSNTIGFIIERKTNHIQKVIRKPHQAIWWEFLSNGYNCFCDVKIFIDNELVYVNGKDRNGLLIKELTHDNITIQEFYKMIESSAN